MAFSTPVLERGNGFRAFSMGKAHPTKVFVAHLELRAHELNKAHLVNQENVSFFKYLDIGDGLPRMGGKTRLQGNVPKDSVDGVEGW